MIDTDKYEGHTPAPWTVRGSGFQTESVIATPKILVGTNSDTKMKVAAVSLGGYDCRREHYMNVKLIADAPLLLAEVKRLREELFNTHAFYSNMEQMLAFVVGIKQGLLTDMSMDDLVDAVNRDYHNRLNEHMDGRLKKND
jgi:hypothetical protein